MFSMQHHESVDDRKLYQGNTETSCICSFYSSAKEEYRTIHRVSYEYFLFLLYFND